jgi:hypothetical protein
VVQQIRRLPVPGQAGAQTGMVQHFVQAKGRLSKKNAKMRDAINSVASCAGLLGYMPKAYLKMAKGTDMHG